MPRGIARMVLVVEYVPLVLGARCCTNKPTEYLPLVKINLATTLPRVS